MESMNHSIDSSLSRRVGAFLIDGLVLGVFGTIGAHIVPVIGGIAVWFFYAPVMEASEVRATIGKHLMGIQVADPMGRRITLRASLIRNVMKLVSAAIVFIGFFVALFTRRRQTLHDLLAETVVVYGRSETPMVDAFIESSKATFRAGEASVDSAMNSVRAPNVVTQLERLEALRRQGALTDAEFEAAKKKILG